MPILHGASGSPFVRKIQVILAEKSIQYEQVSVFPMGVSDEYKRKSPLGKIPCYEDGDFVLPDSSCILAYLERTQPRPPLYPEDAQQFGRALFYEEYSDSKLTETLAPIFFQRFVQPRIFKKEADEKLCREKLEASGTLFDYLEGADFKNGAVTFNSAYGGDNNHGQVWRYTPSSGKLRLLYEVANRDVLDTPDNVAVSPRGGVLLCEDGYPRNFLRGLSADGQVFDFAENLVDGDSEWSGPAYTPDGTWLVVTIQRPGITVAITGPWGSGLL